MGKGKVSKGKEQDGDQGEGRRLLCCVPEDIGEKSRNNFTILIITYVVDPSEKRNQNNKSYMNYDSLQAA